MTEARWQTVSLAGVLELQDRAEVSPSSGEVALVGVRLGGRGVYEASRKSASDVKASKLARVRQGDFIYNRMWATRGTFGIVPPELDGCYATNEFPILRAKNNSVLEEYVALLTQTPFFLAEVDAASVGSTDRRRLHPDRFLEIEINLPPLEEQRTIVDALASARSVSDAAELEARSAFAVLRAAAAALLVPGGSWDALPEGWSLMTLDEIADVRAGITKGRKTDKLLSPQPFIRAANVQDGYLDVAEIKTIEVTADELERFRLIEGDVLMVEGGNAEHLGRGWIWEGQVSDCLHQNHVFRARPDRTKVVPRFLAYSIGTAPARTYCLDKAKKTTNLASINRTQLVALPVALPPLAEQEAIVDQLDRVRALAVASERCAKAARRTERALMGSLFSGGLRLGESDAPQHSVRLGV